MSRALLSGVVTLALTLPAFAALDQSYIPVANGGAGGFPTPFQGSTPTNLNAETFTVGITGDLTEVDAFVVKTSGSTGDLVIAVYNTNAGFPSALLSSVSIPIASVPTQRSFVPAILSSPLPVTAGTSLAVVVHSLAGDSNYSIVGDRSIDVGHEPYSLGTACFTFSSTWFLFGPPGTSSDFGFKTFVTPGVPEPTSLLLLLAATPIFLRRRSV